MKIFNFFKKSNIDQLELKIKLIIQKQSLELTDEEFNDLESQYELAKLQHPSHSTILTFKEIAKVYYKQKIQIALNNNENPFAYERALSRYE